MWGEHHLTSTVSPTFLRWPLRSPPPLRQRSTFLRSSPPTVSLSTTSATPPFHMQCTPGPPLVHAKVHVHHHAPLHALAGDRGCTTTFHMPLRFASSSEVLVPSSVRFASSRMGPVHPARSFFTPKVYCTLILRSAPGPILRRRVLGATNGAKRGCIEEMKWCGERCKARRTLAPARASPPHHFFAPFVARSEGWDQVHLFDVQPPHRSTFLRCTPHRRRVLDFLVKRWGMPFGACALQRINTTNKRSVQAPKGTGLL